MSTRARRTDLLARLQLELRGFSDQDVLFSQIVADRLGLNLTDFKCVSILDAQGPMTAGRLAELTGLTSGAITGVLDRLEKGGFARRSRDPADRRQVIVAASGEKEADFERVLGGSGRALDKLCEDFTDEQLDLIVDFIARGQTFLREQTALLRAAPGPNAPGETSAPLENARDATLRLVSGAANVHIHGAAAADALFQVRFEGREPKVKVRRGVVTVENARFSLLDWRKSSAEVLLSGLIPWRIEVTGGATRIRADLGDVLVSELAFTGGASELDVELPRPSGVVPIRITGGASNVRVLRPPNVGLRLEIHGGASRLTLDGQTLGAIGGKAVLEAPGATGPDRYDVEVTGGASNVSFTVR